MTAEAKHAKEVARLLRKMALTRYIGIGGLVAGIPLALFVVRRTYGIEAAVGGAIASGLLLVVFSFMLYFQAAQQGAMKANLGGTPPIAFHSRDWGYVFLSPVLAPPVALFIEKFLAFPPVSSARFDYATRQLVIGTIQHTKTGPHRQEFTIDVPPNVSAEPLELYCSFFSDAPAEDDDEDAAPRPGTA
jgi:hypothetical protein